MADNYETFILGQDKKCIVSTDCSKTMLNNNIVVIGGSGSGKTTSILRPMILGLEHSNAVGVFSKRSLLSEAVSVLSRRGYKVMLLDFTSTNRNTRIYDPLYCCENDMDIKALAESIVAAGYTGTEVRHDPYWNDSAANIIALVLRYVKHGNYKKAGRVCSSMWDALELLDYLRIVPEKEDDESDKKYHSRIKNYKLHIEFEKLREVDPAGAVDWSAFLDLPNNTAGCVISSARTPLSQIFTADIRHHLKAGCRLNFHELEKEKRILLIYMSPVNTAQHRLVGLLYSQLFQKLFEMGEKKPNGQLPYPVHVLCDDFATGCHVKNFSELISIFREKKISVVMLIQSLSQLNEIYNQAAATTIVNNCDTMIYLGGMDLATCNDIAIRLNKPVQDVLSMPVGQEYFFRRGQKPIITHRYTYTNNKIAKDIASKEDILSFE